MGLIIYERRIIVKTKKQVELVNSFLETLDDKHRPVYSDVIMHLSELGYHPIKEKSSISFKHDLHNKQMAKIGMKISKKYSPFLALRFSACKNYSQRFADVVAAYFNKYPARVARCINGDCDYCAGEPATHVYTYTNDNVEHKHCGAYAIEIPNITSDDIAEIKKLINEEHEYLLKHQVGLL